MNIRPVIHVISFLLFILCLCMGLAAVVSWLKGDPAMVYSRMGLCGLITLVFGSIAFLSTKKRRDEGDYTTGLREGFATVAFAWLTASCFSALPFTLIVGMSLPDSLFEAASGLTTTGASVVCNTLPLRGGTFLPNGIESLPAGILFWRSLLNWLGGVGIVFFVLLILPLLHINRGNLLYNAEVPGLKTDSDQLTPRLFNSVRWVLRVYICLTLCAFCLYKLCGMTGFDALCHAFSTISTGGFSTKNNSFAAFPSPVLQWGTTLLMLMSACNFTLLLRSLITRKLCFWADEEFRFFSLMFLSATIIIAILLFAGHPEGLDGFPRTVEHCLRTAAFQAATVASTTGFTTSDYDAWNLPFASALLLLIMFPCGCGGSTAGGMKCSRLIVIVKTMLTEIRYCLFPHTLTDVRLSGSRLSQNLLRKTSVFVLLYLAIIVIVAVSLLCVTDGSLMTSFSAALTCLSNVGPGFGAVGPSQNFGWMPATAKLILSLTMITGRLEIYTILALFLPSFWRR